MKHATRAAGALKDFGRFLAHTAHSFLIICGFAAVLMLGGYALRGELTNPVGGDALAASDEAVELADEVALSEEMVRVRDWVARRYRVSGVALEPALVEAEQSAREAELDPLLIVAVMAVESSFNPMAESHAGALGLMQVIPRWHMDKIGEGNDYTALFDPRFNVQIGTLVLVEGLNRYGTLEAALQYYNGARHDPERRYAKRVLEMKQRLAAAAARSSGA